MAKIKLILMDMDGTLLNSEQKISSDNIRAICHAQENGIRIGLCSGRGPGDLITFVHNSNLHDIALLTMNGTFCLENEYAEPFASFLLPEDTLRETERILQQEDVCYECFCLNQLAIRQSSRKEFFARWAPDENNHHSYACKITFDEAGLQEARKSGVHKIIAIFYDEEKRRLVYDRLNRLGKLDIASSWVDNCELMPLGHGKGSAVLQLGKRLNIQPDEIMTIGDQDNDLSMFTCGAIGVAMANASPVIKAAAKLHTLSNDENGVAYAIEHFAIQER